MAERPLPPDLHARISKLLPLLASDQDGEVLATARAIGRALDGAGRDFHDLAAALGAGRGQVVIQVDPDTYAAAQTMRAWRDDDARKAREKTEVEDMLATIVERIDTLNDWGRTFIRSISSHVARGRPITPKQAAKIAEIFRTVQNPTVAA